jgi:hypothetical protein
MLAKEMPGTRWSCVAEQDVPFAPKKTTIQHSRFSAGCQGW